MNFGYLVDKIFQELGETGCEAVSDAINFYLANVPVSDVPCSEDVIMLYSLALTFDVRGFNHILPEYDCLRGKMRILGDFSRSDHELARIDHG